MGGIALISILADAVDYFFSETAKRAGITTATSWRLFMAFSLYGNVASIFDVSTANKDGQIGPIHCIRFFSMCWVVMGHFFSNYIVLSANPFDIFKIGKDLFSEFIMNAYFVFLANPFDIFKMGKDLFSEFIMNAYFAVDSFFLIRIAWGVGLSWIIISCWYEYGGGDTFITRCVSTIAVTFLVATFWSAIFEISIGK
ncbi:hypothetical protein PRIPAC_90703, partial [Pristionchus pacificus]